jgi:superfamily II DNA or RNA helicase
MILKQLNLTYLSKSIGIENFNLTRKSFEEISLDGHFQSKLSDKDLAVIIFNNSIKNDFFSKKANLIEFIYALPIITQEKIVEGLSLKSVENIIWDKTTSDFFINELGLDEKFKFRIKKKKNTQEFFTHIEKPKVFFKKLKRYQSDVFFNTYEYISKTPYSRCIIQMPTGSGKTRTAMEIICETINETKKDVLWLANTEELCDQAYGSFLETWNFLKKSKASAINHIRYKNSEQVSSPCFHVTSLQSFNTSDVYNKINSLGINLNTLALLVVDEAHISIAPTYKETISKIISKGAKLIGLTATPGRSLKSNTLNDDNSALSNFFFNKKFELNTGEIEPIEFLRNKGILCNAKFISIEGSKIDSVLSKKEIQECLINKKIPKKIEKLLTNDSHRTAVIFDQLIQLLNNDKKIIFFGTSIVHSKLICSLINLKGFKAAHIDGNSGNYRKDIISSFKEGNIQIICNYGVLSTGFDDPKIDVVFMARPTSSIVLYSQIIGRGLRGPLIGGTETCEVYTVFDNFIDLPENNEIYSYFDEYFIQ